MSCSSEPGLRTLTAPSARPDVARPAPVRRGRWCRCRRARRGSPRSPRSRPGRTSGSMREATSTAQPPSMAGGSSPRSRTATGPGGDGDAQARAAGHLGDLLHDAARRLDQASARGRRPAAASRRRASEACRQSPAWRSTAARSASRTASSRPRCISAPKPLTSARSTQQRLELAVGGVAPGPVGADDVHRVDVAGVAWVVPRDDLGQDRVDQVVRRLGQLPLAVERLVSRHQEPLHCAPLTRSRWMQPSRPAR